MFFYISIIAIVITVTLLLLVLFEPGLRYDVEPPKHALESKEYLCVLGALADAQVLEDSQIEVLTNGPAFYESMLDAIRSAKHSVNMEAYIFRKDATGKRFVEALAERARAGVRVNLIVDSIGSFTTWQKTFDPLTQAGGRMYWYQPIRLMTLKRLNNRTHRELLVVDGEIGFIGGAGIADEWATGTKDDPRWRDTFVRVSGDLVIGLQTTFTENWLESSEEILTGDDCFPACTRMTRDDGDRSDETSGFVVNSSPTAGRSTRSRVLFQTLLCSAQKTIRINSPYFLPDRSVRKSLVAAAKRGVSVKIIAPGKHSDHLMTRNASRRRYGELLKGGCEIYEYEPSMIHVKALLIDGIWSVVGSTNFDNRSFGLNDEVNLAMQDTRVAERLAEDFENDLKQSQQITYEEWSKRPWTERLGELAGIIIERQQ